MAEHMSLIVLHVSAIFAIVAVNSDKDDMRTSELMFSLVLVSVNLGMAGWRIAVMMGAG